jgi:TolA-binding protein
MRIRRLHIVKISKNAVFIGSLCVLSACTTLTSSLSDIKLFGDKENTQPDNNLLDNKEQSKRDALIAGKSSRPSLKSLDLQPIATQELSVPQLSLAQKQAQYEALLPLITDPTQKQQAAFRLADIKILIAENNQEEGNDLQTASASFNSAINDYRKVLSENEIIFPTDGLALSTEQQALNRKQMDAMYQLARALDLSANPSQSMEVAKQFLATFSTDQFTLTQYHLELYFRIGEYHFNRQQYSEAINYYSKVIAFGSDGLQNSTNFYGISAYMLGWSHFKLDDYQQAMRGFANMLDAKLINNKATATLFSASDLRKYPIDELTMPKGERRLVFDAIRVMALTFSYQGNGDAIHSFFNSFGRRDYEQLIFDELAQQYLDNDRYQDSAKVLLSFASQNPVHPRAVEFYIRHIDAYVLGGFETKVLEAKEGFVQTYSLGNSVVENLNTPIGRDASPYLREYILQLAQTEHSIAQSINNAELSRDSYARAKAHYENYIRTFSPSPEVKPLRFYLAEALLALNEFEAAIEAFESYAYFYNVNTSPILDESETTKQSSDAPSSADAAYAALLAYQKMNTIAMLATNNQSQTQLTEPQGDFRSTMPFNVPLNMRQKSQAKFAKTFINDSRAPTVALNLMKDLFARENYMPAQEWATWLLAQESFNNTMNVRESAMLVMAHSDFAMQEYADAALGYRALLDNVVVKSEKPTLVRELSDRLAASLYKQAEMLLINNKVNTTSLQAQKITTKSELSFRQLEAIKEGVRILQQVVNETPYSEFRMAAQYDSAVYFLLLENFSKAISAFTDFKARYPENPLSQGIEQQLFYAYTQTDDWANAAPILFNTYARSPNSERGRLALFQAAEYFEKAGNRWQALDTYRTYAHEFPMPMKEANEARFKLTEFYLKSGEAQKRRFWLNKLVQAQQASMQQSPSTSTARSVYLGSMAAMVFASDADYVYTRIKLKQPLDKSLQKKQAALKKAIQEYERVISFASVEFLSAANYKLANLYTTLAQDLMDSSRPSGLSALELSQYEMLLEEQAYPFEETAISMHEKNFGRASSGLYDKWVKESFAALQQAMPARYNKPEIKAEVTVDDL